MNPLREGAGVCLKWRTPASARRSSWPSSPLPPLCHNLLPAPFVSGLKCLQHHNLQDSMKQRGEFRHSTGRGGGGHHLKVMVATIRSCSYQLALAFSSSACSSGTSLNRSPTKP